MSALSAKAIKAVSQVAARANSDAGYAESLTANPHAELAKAGFDVPSGLNIHFVSGAAPESTDTDVYLNLLDLNSIGDLELNEEKMAKVAGGGSCQSTASTALTIPSCLSSSSTASTRC
jgi:hypothetical protein